MSIPDFPFHPSTRGERIAHARRVFAVKIGHDIGQTDVAKYLATSASAVSNWESDTKRPSERFSQTLADALGSRAGYLYFGEEPMEAPLTAEVLTRWKELLAPAREADDIDAGIETLDPGVDRKLSMSEIQRARRQLEQETAEERASAAREQRKHASPKKRRGAG